MINFLTSTPTAPILFSRSYSRWTENGRETFENVTDRCIAGLIELGKLTASEAELLRTQMASGVVFPSGRWLWCGGTKWASKPANYYGTYNCSSTEVNSVEAFGYLMNLAMTGCGTGANLEPRNIEQLPIVKNRINIIEVIDQHIANGNPATQCYQTPIGTTIFVGDSRQGWAKSYLKLLEIAFGMSDYSPNIVVDLSFVRPAGEKLKGFGGTANPVKLPQLYTKIADILNGAVGRQLTALECSLLIDEAALVVVAGSIRRSAGIRQFDEAEPNHKENLWVETNGKWSIDPKRDALRMANHTRVFHQKPTLEQCIDSVRSQYYSGEGAIMWAGEAVARSNADVLTGVKKYIFLDEYDRNLFDAKDYLYLLTDNEDELDHRMNRYGLNPCGEITGSNFLCDLADVHLNRLNPLDLESQGAAFKAAAINVCCLLHHQFDIERYRYSRELDPIVGVSFTGLFDFFVNLFGVDWLLWWQAGRPEYWGVPIAQCPHQSIFFRAKERYYLQRWQKVVTETVAEYCTRHNLKVPNRCTTVQPSGSKSLLTGASPGWHPPKAQQYIRRITFAKNDPIALAAIDYGYRVIPSQSDKDENGNLLGNPFDSRCTEWLVEIPCQVAWANLEGVQDIDLSKFSALAQFDFYMQVQQHYTHHNTSSTIELREAEIEPLATRIYEAIQNDEGYISSALLTRFDDLETFPRLPFEPIDKDTYQDLMVGAKMRRVSDNFDELLAKYDRGVGADGSTSGGCDSDKCLLPDPTV